MKILLRSAKIYNTSSPLNGEKVDLLIENGTIRAIGAKLPKPADARVIESPNLGVSPGWLDIGAQHGDPGHEHREDLSSLASAAAAGGYTGIAPFPNTHPPIHSKSEVAYIRNRTRELAVDFLPVGAISHGCEGKDIAEMYDMRHAGAVAFSDGKRSLQHAGLMLRALQYVRPFDGLIVNQPVETCTGQGGQMNEGVMSTMLGLRGMPNLSEVLMVQRDLSILEYAGSRLHLFGISTAESVALIRDAKRRGLQVSASVPAINLALDDTALEDFDTNLKLMPPLRSKSDMSALTRGLRDGTIDCIVSNHVPLDVEAKDLEFLYAEFGMIGLETAFAVASTAVGGKLTDEVLVEKFYLGPRKVLQLPVPEIADGAPANLTIFDAGLKWTFSERDVHSKSKNTSLLGKEFTGKVLGIINRGMLILND
jgi:dihydroorotase